MRAAMLILAAAGASATAGVTEFTETFESGDANWLNGADLALSEVAAGAKDGSAYVSTTLDLNNAGPFGLTIFRGESSSGASGGAFAGDYIAGGITTVSFDVRHNAGQDLDIALRLASPFNFPAIGVQSGTLVASDTWTTVTFEIDPSNPLLVVEPPFTPADYESILSNIGNFQISSFRPGGLSSPLDVTFDLDNVSITPTPSSAVLLGFGGLVATRRRR
jgi:hypothetical protein